MNGVVSTGGPGGCGGLRVSTTAVLGVWAAGGAGSAWATGSAEPASGIGSPTLLSAPCLRPFLMSVAMGLGGGDVGGGRVRGGEVGARALTPRQQLLGRLVDGGDVAQDDTDVLGHRIRL